MNTRTTTPAATTIRDRVARERGRADDHPCSCGRRANRWVHLPGLDKPRTDPMAWGARCYSCATPPRPEGADAPRYKSIVSYRARHDQLTRRYGEASAYPCIDCKAEGTDHHADEWSLVHDAPDRIIDQATGHPLVMSDYWYVTRCYSHHRRADRLAKGVTP